MLQTIKHYLSVYVGFISTSFAEAMSFRTSFVLIILMDLLFYFVSLSSANLLFSHVDMIGHWDKNQFLFFIAFILSIDHLHMTFVSENFWNLSFLIRTGGMDFILLKPVSSIFSTFFRNVHPSSMLNGIVTTSFLIYFGQQVHLSTLAWFMLPFLVVLSFFLLIFIEFIIATSIFWTIEGLGINFLRMQCQHLSRWPDFIYAKTARRFFIFVIPVLVVGSAPVNILLGFNVIYYLLILLFALVLSFIVLQFVWQKALKQYDSASS